ncbi:MAG: hypothetical protein WD063_12575 [Pirellulales bacterium]
MRHRRKTINRPVMSLEDTHPAKRFLCAFDECLLNCGGCELGLYETPIDQEWRSATDSKVWKFSAFVYTYLAFDIQLDGFITSAPQWTASETWALEQLPRFHALMDECAHAAAQCGNTDCLELVDEVVQMLKLWKEYLRYREESIARQRAVN